MMPTHRSFPVVANLCERRLLLADLVESKQVDRRHNLRLCVGCPEILILDQSFFAHRIHLAILPIVGNSFASAFRADD